MQLDLMIRGQSKVMRNLKKSILRAADCSSTVLITGESGTGKELIARAIHELGAREREPFLAINCGALYVPQEDIIRYNKGSKVFGINEGDYGRVLSTTHADNELTVKLQDGREVTYNPKRLSGVSVYKEANRQFAVGDRIQFRAPFREANVKNTELGTITNIVDEDFTISLSGGRVITFTPERFPHLDHGYAVTSYSSQGKTMDRVLVNAETTETDLLVNQRKAYVAVSRARLDARLYTDSAADLWQRVGQTKR
jgi:ATP-dependent exoDNAse (exonuclease V) alpha subunit